MAMLLGLVARVVSVPRCLFFVGAASVELHLGGPGHAAAAPRGFSALLIGFFSRRLFACILWSSALAEDDAAIGASWLRFLVFVLLSVSFFLLPSLSFPLPLSLSLLLLSLLIFFF